MSFKDLGLNKHLVKSVSKMGFVSPTPIQEEAIPKIIEGNSDLVGLAQTGTGKTAAFGLPMIQLTDFTDRNIQGVVICPTRELCLQISKDFKEYCRYSDNAGIVAVYGGASILNQIREIKRNAHIIIATPGRLLDLINRKVIKLGKVKYLVLDEADEMLNMGFKEDLDEILDKTPDTKQTWLFSATMPKEVANIARTYMTNPVEITIGKRNSGASNIVHMNYVIREKDRYPALKRIIDFYPDIYGLIFCRTRKETQEISEKLIKDGYDAEALHGDLSQQMRDMVMKRFREKNLQILVATDVAARGIDVDNISHVINYRLPDEIENYTHRSGRTARAGKSGISVALVNIREQRKIRDIERKAGISFTTEKIPSGRAICEKQLFSMVNRLVTAEVDEDEVGPFLPPVYTTLESLSKEELIRKFVSLEFNRFLNYYRHSGDINVSPSRQDSHAGPGNKKSGNFRSRRLFLDAGSLDNLNKGGIIRLICEKSGIRSNKIGTIDILREFTFLEVDTNVADKIIASMKGAKLDGKKISLQFAQKKPDSSKNRKPRRKSGKPRR